LFSDNNVAALNLARRRRRRNHRVSSSSILFCESFDERNKETILFESKNFADNLSDFKNSSTMSQYYTVSESDDHTTTIETISTSNGAKTVQVRYNWLSLQCFTFKWLNFHCIKVIMFSTFHIIVIKFAMFYTKMIKFSTSYIKVSNKKVIFIFHLLRSTSLK
jgi:hypothetical protein